MSTYWVMVMYLMEVGMPPVSALLDTLLAYTHDNKGGDAGGTITTKVRERRT
jgi:hypothetical protein